MASCAHFFQRDLIVKAGDGVRPAIAGRFSSSVTLNRCKSLR
jgi:hypothetical protein